jgi:hypothetical protein
MKKDRDIIPPYPIYPPYQNVGPMFVPNMYTPYVSPSFMNTSCSSNTDTSSIEQRLNNLEKRVSSLENMMNSSNSISNSYNSKNYQML